jgi:hypothetical protein
LSYCGTDNRVQLLSDGKMNTSLVENILSKVNSKKKNAKKQESFPDSKKIAQH